VPRTATTCCCLQLQTLAALVLGSQRLSCPLARCSINPYAEYMYDGVNLSPFEVMFVKVGQGKEQGKEKGAKEHAGW